MRRVQKKVDAWLVRHSADAAPASASLEACATIAMRRGIVSRNPAAAGKEASDTPMEKPPHEFRSVEFEGFNLNASVQIDGDDDLARERLMRYGARPPFALERLGRRPDGSITYRIKKLAHGAREKVRVLTPLEFLARLSALIPPPRYPLVRCHGVLAPASKWRRDVVPKPREANAACKRPVAKAAKAKMPPAEVPAAGQAPQEIRLMDGTQVVETCRAEVDFIFEN